MTTEINRLFAIWSVLEIKHLLWCGLSFMRKSTQHIREYLLAYKIFVEACTAHTATGTHVDYIQQHSWADHKLYTFHMGRSVDGHKKKAAHNQTKMHFSSAFSRSLSLSLSLIFKRHLIMLLLFSLNKYISCFWYIKNQCVSASFFFLEHICASIWSNIW